MKLEKELFWYVVFGVLTTVVNIVVYYVFSRLGVNYLISNATTTNAWWYRK